MRLIWGGERVRPEYHTPAPTVDQCQVTPEGISLVSLEGLVQMKLQSNRDRDRVHLRDLIGVGLVGREMMLAIPAVLADRLEALLQEAGR